jgi:hypothetical protein
VTKVAEGSGELDTKILGVIPYLFFDLIARVTPGLLLLFGIDLEYHQRAISWILRVIFPEPKLRESPAAWLAVLLVAGYILGHALSPLAKLLEQFGFSIEDQAWTKYDALRISSPGAGAIAMRIRAEYVMYGGFAIVLALLLLLWAGEHIRQGLWSGYTFTELALVTGTLIMAWLMYRRNNETRKTFQKSVTNLHKALVQEREREKESVVRATSRNDEEHSGREHKRE